MKQFDLPIVYAAKHKDESIRMNSRSGGVFTAVSDYVLEHDGAIYGCVLTDRFEAKHIRATTKEDRDRMRGSKYIQSESAGCFNQVETDIMSGKPVLFTGTSCQVQSLIHYLRVKKVPETNMENLLSMDILCHGVPSVRVWKDYICDIEKKHSGKCVDADFRNKKDYGWKRHIESLTLKGHLTTRQYNGDLFKRMFYSHEILRPACYECPYKTVSHGSDITIGDYWGIEKAAPGFNDDRGVSLVLINNEHGQQMFDRIADQLKLVSTKIEDSMQPALQKPFARPERRDRFWEDYNQFGFEYVADRYFGENFVKREKKRIKQTLYRLRFKRQLKK